MGMGVRVFSLADEAETLYFFPYEPSDDVAFDCSIYDDLSNFNQGCNIEAVVRLSIKTSF